MILAQLGVATLAFGIAAGPTVEAPVRHLSMQQRNAAAQAYVRPATDCIASNVAANARFRKDDPAVDLGDLIVEAMPGCLEPVRAMIDAYDRYFGEGSGQEFFMGPYLDVLPRILLKRTSAPAQ
jgi:hypothetical protein